MAIIRKVAGVSHPYNPAGLVPGGAKPVVARAIQQAATMPALHPQVQHPAGPTIKVGGVQHSYNPAGFVRGGATPPVARAIQTAATGPVLKTRAAVKKKAAAVVAANPMQQIVNRYIASLLTPQQQQQQAQAGIDAQLKASLAAINTAYSTDNATLQRQQERAHTYAMALNSMRDMSGAQTEADYQNAAARIQGLGTGLTGTIADAQQATANDAAAKIAAATGGLGQAQGLDVAGMKNIAQYTGVTMPATNLYSEAANQAAQARLQQDVRGQQVENIAGDWGQKIADAATAHAGKVADVQATRPSLYQAAITAAQTGNRSDLATIISALALQNQTAQTPSKIGLTTAKTGLTGAQTKATKVKSAVDVGKTTGIVTVNGKPTLAKNSYWTSPGTKTAAAIPTGWKLDPTDATGHSIMPTGDFYWSGPGRTEPAKIPTGWKLFEGDTTHHIIVPSTGDYYWAGPGHTQPTAVPKNWILDPSDPTHHKIKQNPAAFAPKTPKTPKDKAAAQAKQTQALIKDWSKTIDDSLFATNSPYVKDTSDPYEVSKGYAKSHWVPAKTYPAAFAAMLAQVPPSLRQNTQMIANINATLARGGYKIPGPGAKTTTKKKPKQSAIDKAWRPGLDAVSKALK